MRTLIIVAAIFFILPLSAFRGNKTLRVTSPAFHTNEMIPAKYTCLGARMSPPITVDNIPAGTKSLAIIIQDADQGNFTNWIIWDLDTEGVIPEGFMSNHVGLNGLNQEGYSPMCAVSGTHHFHFIAYALDVKLDVRGSSTNRFNTDGPSTNKAKLQKLMKGHILGWGEMIGTLTKNME